MKQQRSVGKSDLTNKIINNILVIERCGSHKRNSFWVCKCFCGKEFKTIGTSLRAGRTRSCGCLKHLGNKSPHWKGCGEFPQQFYLHIKSSAKIRNLEFDITIEELWNLFVKQNGKCALSGRDLTFGIKGKNKIERTVSLDRIDNNIGYIKQNVQWVHKDINYMKQDYNMEYFLQTCKEIYEYNILEKNH